MNYEEVLERVLDYTKRPDLEDIARTAIVNAMRRFQLAATYPEDRIHVRIDYDKMFDILDMYNYPGYLEIPLRSLLEEVNTTAYGTTVSGIRAVEYITDHGFPCPAGSYPSVTIKEYLQNPRKYPRAFVLVGQSIRIYDPSISFREDEYGNRALVYDNEGYDITFICYRNAFVDSGEEAA